MNEIDLPPLDATRFASMLRPEQQARFASDLELAASALGGRTFWHLNSTATGGGVAEMLQSVLCYLQGGGVRTRWAVIDGDEDFFVVTKRIHHLLHGSKGDGGELGEQERCAYMGTLERQINELTTMVQPGDVVVLHDPQTVGLASHIRRLGAAVIWSCHVGTDAPNEFSYAAWEFLGCFANTADAVVFSRNRYAWDNLDPGSVNIIPPCIDAFSPKNQLLEPGTVASILAASGIIPDEATAEPTFHRQEGAPATVRAGAEMIQDLPLDRESKIVTQISRWDPLKDHAGVMEGFCRYVPDHLDAHLVLAGPSPESIADDPEGAQTFEELRDAWAGLPSRSRRRVHIACLPMDDAEQNAAIVNALQRRSDVIIQKSLAEGFGLTVTEAMWKGAPTVASAVGGLRDQIEHDVSGLLVDDPGDLAGFGGAVTHLIEDADRAKSLGAAARSSVRDRYLAPSYLARFIELALEVHRA